MVDPSLYCEDCCRVTLDVQHGDILFRPARQLIRHFSEALRSEIACTEILYSLYPIERRAPIRHTLMTPRLGDSGFWSRRIALRTYVIVRLRRTIPPR
jgi:hypothetical protein